MIKYPFQVTCKTKKNKDKRINLVEDRIYQLVLLMKTTQNRIYTACNINLLPPDGDMHTR